IRKGPSASEPVLKTSSKNEKLNYLETIANDSKWYHITWYENNQQLFGFVNADVVIKREYQFDKMQETIQKAEDSYSKGPLTYIHNYHNAKGYAPSYHGNELDSSGGRRSQSAPGYPDPARPDEFSYIGDGTLIRVLSSDAKYTKVALVKDEKVYYVPNKYVVTPAAITEIKKAVVIDRGNQNEVVFEKIGTEWKVISYSMATTGATGKYQQPTPLGYFYGIEKKERFYYYKDGTTTIQGYAPYAIRFAGGAYVHGVPVNFKFSEDGKRIDPGKIEYSKTLGTVPLSHKCVRNYTSHAKFLYDWYTPGEMIVVVME
ncbi:MAG: L,D-transpeptidase, partial [Bacillota bacterium]